MVLLENSILSIDISILLNLISRLCAIHGSKCIYEISNNMLLVNIDTYTYCIRALANCVSEENRRLDIYN